jgi:hypothetical protein
MTITTTTDSTWTDGTDEVTQTPATPAPTGPVTPYQAAKLVNAELAKRGVEKTLPPQMFYNYTAAKLNAGKNPMIPATKDENNKVWIEQADLAVWFEKYYTKNYTTA